MVKVYLNPANLTDKIYHLGSFSSHTDVMSNNIRNRSHDLHDPIMGTPLPGSLSPISPGDIDYLTGAIKKSLTFINARIAEIEKCKKTIENLSSNGVAIPHSQGDITFEVPDDSAGLETADKLQKWAQGATDANDLRSGKLTFRSGRSFDEVMESMKANKGDTTYANSFIDRAGPENLTKLGDGNPNNNREAPVIGEILSTASQTWNKEKSKKNADLIIGSVDDKEEWNRIPILNQMMANHDADGDGINDLKFGTDFLVSMGNAAEKMPIDEIKKWREPFQTEKTTGNYPFDVAYDPLFGVIDAMSSKDNEEAARAFLAPIGGTADEVSRIKTLMGRNSIGDNKWSDNWAHLGMVTAENHSGDTIDPATGKGSLESKQAATIAAGVVNAFGERIKATPGGYDSISGTARSRLRRTLSCYPYAVDQKIGSVGEFDGEGVMMPKQDDGRWDKGIGYQPKFSVSGLVGSIQTISRDEGELKALTKSVSELEGRRMTHAVAYGNGDKPWQNEELKDAIKAKSDVSAFFLGASRAPIEGDAKAIDDINNIIINTIFAGSYLPGAGETLKDAWKSSYEFSVNNIESHLQNAASDTFTQNLAMAMEKSAVLADGDNKAASVSTVLQLMELGYIDKSKVNQELAVQDFEDANGDGNREDFVKVVDDQGNIDLSKYDSKTIGNVMDEIYKTYVQESGYLGGDAHDGFINAEKSYNDCYNKGRLGHTQKN